MPSLRVLLVTNWPLTNEAGGVGTVVRSLAQAILARGHEVQLLIPEWRAVHVETTTEVGFRTHRLRLRAPCDGKAPMKNFLGFLWDFPVVFPRLAWLLRSEAFDVVHLHFASAYHGYFRIARTLGGPPYIVTLHRGETVNFPDSSKCEQTLVTWSLGGAQKVVAVSAWLADLAMLTFGVVREVGCVHNGYDVEKSSGAESVPMLRGALDALPDKFLLMVANVSYYKAPDVAIRAWGILRRVHPDVHLIIVGEPRDYWDASLELIDELDCREQVHMVGAMPHAAVLRLMESAMGLVMPSRNEGFGVVIVEAGLKKLPVICSRIGPFLEIVDDQKTAITVPVEDPGALASAVSVLASSPERRSELGAALESAVKARFSVGQMTRSYIELYSRACGKPVMRDEP